ncbi:MAG: MBL fold metallo-hydrolase [Bacteroidetes bacterium 4572_77]|nr:MAG: MBL fold metallo-hydrolase [Bacteroidetes bacterium 4572_77]
MNHINFSALNVSIEDLLHKPTLLFDDKNGHQIYWLGINEETAFRCNTYLIVDNEEAFIVDPGSRMYFEFVKQRVLDIIPLKQLKGMILCHQDPDVAGSSIDWLELNPKLLVVSSDRTNVLLPHYGIKDYDFYSIGLENNFRYQFSSGHILQFIEAPFLHFPGAFTIFDKESQFLLSGDIWAALDIDWKLVIDDFDSHTMKLDLFHLDYMASNVAARGFAMKIQDMKIEAILPQHGSIIPKKFVVDAIKYLEELQCGLDIVYPELSN